MKKERIELQTVEAKVIGFTASRVKIRIQKGTGWITLAVPEEKLRKLDAVAS